MSMKWNSEQVLIVVFSLLRVLNAEQRDWHGLAEIPRLIGHRSIREALLDFLNQCHAVRTKSSMPSILILT
jgi:hypothetical protein